MKKMLLILGVLVIIGALVSGMTVAYAKGNGNGVKQGNQLCEELLTGTIIQVTGNAEAGTITLLPRGGNTTVNIVVNSDTKYRVWMAPNQDIGFGNLGCGDWIAVCIKNGVARTVVLLETPERPFYLKLEGNVTAVNGNVITGNINGGGNFTINLTGGVGGNFTRAAGQPIVLDIGKNGPPAWGILQGPNMKRLMEGIGLWMRNHEGKMWQFGD